MTPDPHGASGIVSRGAELGKAQWAMVLLHGRGGSAEDILGLGAAIASEDWALLAPQAAGHTWYPNSFLAQRGQNEPYLSSALHAVSRSIAKARAAGIPDERIVVAGFSQGACLATEYVGRNPARYGGLLAFTGGLIGPPGEPITLAGDLAGTPVLLSAGDPDPHVPWARVEQSAELLKGIGGVVTLRRFPGKAHSIVSEEVESARQLLQSV